jgi:hypothetical protein
MKQYAPGKREQRDPPEAPNREVFRWAARPSIGGRWRWSGQRRRSCGSHRKARAPSRKLTEAFLWVSRTTSLKCQISWTSARPLRVRFLRMGLASPSSRTPSRIRAFRTNKARPSPRTDSQRRERLGSRTSLSSREQSPINPLRLSQISRLAGIAFPKSRWPSNQISRFPPTTLRIGPCLRYRTHRFPQTLSTFRALRESLRLHQLQNHRWSGVCRSNRCSSSRWNQRR